MLCATVAALWKQTWWLKLHPQGPASNPSDGLADLLKMGAGIAQGLMAIFTNKVNFLVSLLSDKVLVYTIHKQR